MPDPLKQKYPLGGALEFEKEVQRQMMLLEQEFQAKLKATEGGAHDSAAVPEQTSRDIVRDSHERFPKHGHGVDDVDLRRGSARDAPPVQPHDRLWQQPPQQQAPPQQHHAQVAPPHGADPNHYKFERPHHQRAEEQGNNGNNYPQYGDRRDAPRRKGGGVAHMYDAPPAHEASVAGIMGNSPAPQAAVESMSPNSRKKGARGLASMYDSEEEARRRSEVKSLYSEQLAQQVITQ